MDQFEKLNSKFNQVDKEDLLENGGMSKRRQAQIKLWNTIFGVVNHFLGD